MAINFVALCPSLSPSFYSYSARVGDEKNKQIILPGKVLSIYFHFIPC